MIAIAALLAGWQRGAAAHALAQRYDLPLPLGYFLLAAGAAVAATFIILVLTARRPELPGSRISHGRVFARGIVPSAAVVALQTVSIALLFLIVSAGFLGHQNPFKNLAPVAVWVIWWVGLALVSAFIANVWALLNPFAAVFDFAQWLAERRGGSLSLRRPYPAWLGAWPACALFLLFMWLELVAPGRDVPRNIAIAMLIYLALNFTGCVAFGRDVWLRSGDVFAIVFELFGRFAPLHFRRDHVWHWTLRPFASGLHARAPLDASMIGFALLALGSVTIDGVMETPVWASIVETIFAASGREPAEGPVYMLLATALLIAGPLCLAALYVAAIGIIKRIAGGPRLTALAGAFVLSLVPIAIAYHLAHYFSLLAIAGQFIIPLASDPFGYGWDLFGTMLYRVDIGVVDARFVWYLSVVAIVTGHIIAVWLAHIAALRIYKDPAMARRSQYPMLLLMVGYTMLSLWILAQPIVVPNVASAALVR